MLQRGVPGPRYTFQLGSLETWVGGLIQQLRLALFPSKGAMEGLLVPTPCPLPSRLLYASRQLVSAGNPRGFCGGEVTSRRMSGRWPSLAPPEGGGWKTSVLAFPRPLRLCFDWILCGYCVGPRAATPIPGSSPRKGPCVFWEARPHPCLTPCPSQELSDGPAF